MNRRIFNGYLKKRLIENYRLFANERERESFGHVDIHPGSKTSVRIFSSSSSFFNPIPLNRLFPVPIYLKIPRDDGLSHLNPSLILQFSIHLSAMWAHIHVRGHVRLYIRQTCFHHCSTVRVRSKEFSADLPNGSSKRQSMRSEWPVGFFVPMISAPLISSSESRLTHCPEPSCKTRIEYWLTESNRNTKRRFSIYGIIGQIIRGANRYK